MSEFLLELDGITKAFGSVVALENATLALRPGTVHAVLGENGAGKTTLLRVAFGMVRPDSGAVRINGQPCTLNAPADALRAGVGMVHQHFTLVPAMTVRENLLLGERGLFDPHKASATTIALAKRTGFALDPLARVEDLSVSAQQRVEIAKALVRDPSVLILDEPTAVLAPPEAQELRHWLRAFASEGKVVVLITHKIPEALEIADDVTVMRGGHVVLSVRAAEASADSIALAMLGTSLSTEARIHHPDNDVVVFAARQLTLRGPSGRLALHNASFDIRAGEIVGIAAIEGTGQHELLQALAGRRSVDGGSLSRPTEVGFVPEDRHRDAVMLDRSLTENVALRGAGNRGGMMDWPRLESESRQLMERFDVRAEGPRAPMRSLSGGNQQKLVLARELSDNAQAIIADNPTRGLDIRAAAAVRTRLQEAAAAGAAIVVYSSDLDELIAISTRVLVLRDGALLSVASEREAVGRLMIGTQLTSAMPEDA